EKPPFHLWMTALSYHAFGVGEWQARLWVALSGAIGLLMTMWAARRWFGVRVAVLTGLVLLATPMWNLASHFNSLDMSISGALACVLAGMLMAQHPEATPKSRRAWMWFAWGAIGVAVLTKGLIGIVLPGLVLVCYTLAARDWVLWRRLHIVSGALLMLAISAPWFVLVSSRNPEFLPFFFIHEHWERYTTTIHQRGAPVWYFVPQLLADFLPWIGLCVGIGAVLRLEARREGFRPALLLAIWAGAIFAFFSLSHSKLPGYIVPIFPALAILAALALDRLDLRRWNRQLVAMLCLAVLGLLACAWVGGPGASATQNAVSGRYAWWLVAACALAVAGLVAARAVNRAGHLLPSIAVYSLTLFAATTLGLLAHETVGRGTSGIALVAPMRAVLTPEMPIYSVQKLDHTLPFYLQRTTIMVEAPDELEFGTQQEPQKWLPTLDAFLAEWSSGRRAMAIMSPGTYASLRRQNVIMFPLVQDARRVAVTNFAWAPQ
ncbi:MAG TPA: glycosyltransferase family 39 protein, partial [Rhizobacter sp.]|nr:glycosyltransferase family 39 protein [Rhizobacter sp.]